MRKVYLLPLFAAVLFFFNPVAARSAECTFTGTYTTSPAPPWCPFDTVLVTAVPTGGTGPYTYEWSDGTPTAGHEVIMDGTFHQYVTITDANGCTAEVLVHVKPNIYSTAFIYPLNGICEGESGLLTVFGSGVLTYTYAWENGATTQSIPITQPGVYTVTLTVVETGCTREVSAFIPLPVMPAPTISITGPPGLCAGQNGTLTVNGGSFQNYAWSPGGQTTPTLGINGPGAYAVTVSNPGECSATDVIDIAPGAVSPPDLNGPPNLCPGQNGSISVANSAGYTSFAWSTGQSTPNIGVNQPGTYTVTVTAPGGCTATGGFTVDPSGQAPNPIVSATPSLPGQGNGTVDLSVSPPDNYTFLWSNGAASEDLAGLNPGSYTVTVTGPGGCSATATALVPVLACNLNGTIASSIPPPFCPGDAVTLTAQPIGGAGPFTYAWESGANTQSIQIVMPADHYIDMVTITDAEGCTHTVSIHFKAAFLSVGFTWPLGGICAGDSALLQAFVSGAAPVTYHWQNGSASNGMYITQAGTYSVTMTNTATGCTHTEDIDVPLQVNPAPAPQLSGPPVLCPGQTATLAVNGGPFQSYLWTPGGQTTPTISVNGPGTYTVSVGNGGICHGADAITILPEQEPPPQLTGAASICPGQSATLGIANSGDYATFHWNTGQNTPTITVNQPQTYSVTVTAAGGCTATGSITVSPDPAGPGLTTSATPATCSQANGAADLTVAPAGSYVFLWSDGSGAEDLAGVAAGTYTVTVTSSGGCSATTSVVIAGGTIVPVIDGAPAPNTACTGANGSLDVTVSPAGAYNFNWSNGATTEDLTGLPAGNYTVTVSAGGACTGTAVFNVTNNTNSPTATPAITAATCGQSNGAVGVAVSGGTAPVIYLWSNGATTPDLNGVAAGNYSLTVTGADGCTASLGVVVPDNAVALAVDGLASPNTACTGANGSLDVNVSPAGAYNFNWSNGATTEDLTGLPAGNYAVTVSAGGACTGTAVFNIVDNTNNPTATPAITAATCGQSNGAVGVAVSGGTAPVIYLWSNGATTPDLNGVAAGNYSLTVTGADGCTASLGAVVPDNAVALSVDGLASPNTACTGANGSLDVNVSPAGAYNFSWSNGATTEDLTGLPAGNYAVTVSAGTGCTGTAAFSVTDNAINPTVTPVSTPATCGQSNGAIDVTVTAAQAPLTYIWSNGATTEDLSGIAPGSYALTVTGANGCVTNANATIPDNHLVFSLTASTVANTACAAPNGNLALTVTPAGSYAFLWSTGATTPGLQNLSAGAYAVTVTSGLNCTATAVYTLADSSGAPVVSLSATPASCGFSNGNIDLTVDAGSAGATYLWSNGATTEDLPGIAAGNYAVTVTGPNGCNSLQAVTVPDNSPAPALAGTATANTACQGGNGSLDLTVSPAGTYAIAWSNGATSEDLAGLGAGAYTVTVSAGGACTTTAVFTINDSLPVTTLNGATTAHTSCTLPDGAIDLQVSPAGAYQFDWSNGATTEDLSGLAAAAYAVTVTAGNGCTSVAGFTVISTQNIPAVATAATPDTCGQQKGGVTLTVNNGAAPFQFLWSNGATTADLAGLTPQTYTVTVTDANGCTGTGSAVVTPSPQPAVAIEGPGLACPGASVEWVASPGFSAYQWSNGQSAGNISIIAPGDYAVTVTDQHGCTAMAVATFGHFPAPAVVLSGPAAMCDGNTATLSAAGSFTQLLWSNGAVSADITVSQAGNYAVTATDANGCTATAARSVSIQQPVQIFLEKLSCLAQDTGLAQVSLTTQAGCDSLVITHTALAPALAAEAWVTSDFNGQALPCHGSSQGMVAVLPAGGTAPFVFHWNNGASGASLQNLAADDYTVTVTDANGCSATGEVALADPAPLVATTSSQQVACFTPGEIRLENLQGGTAPYTLQAMGGTFETDGSEPVVIPNVPPGSYPLVVTDANGCSLTQTVPMTAPAGTMQTFTQSYEATPGDTVQLQAPAGFNAVSMTWSPAAGLSCTDCPDPWLVAGEERIYTVVLHGFGNCRVLGVDTISLRSIDTKTPFYVPNVIHTGAGENGVFTIFAGEGLSNIRVLRVYTRWGELVTEVENFPPNGPLGWPGDFRGRPVDPAVFAYYAELEFTDGTLRKIKGDVTVVR